MVHYAQRPPAAAVAWLAQACLILLEAAVVAAFWALDGCSAFRRVELLRLAGSSSIRRGPAGGDARHDGAPGNGATTTRAEPVTRLGIGPGCWWRGPPECKHWCHCYCRTWRCWRGFLLLAGEGLELGRDDPPRRQSQGYPPEPQLCGWRTTHPHRSCRGQPHSPQQKPLASALLLPLGPPLVIHSL